MTTYAVNGLGYVPVRYYRAGLGTLTIDTPPLGMWSRSLLHDQAARLMAAVASLAQDVGANQTRIRASSGGDRILSDWQSFKNEWSGQYARNYHDPSITAPLTNLGGRLQDYVARFNALETRIREAGVSVTGSEERHEEPPPEAAAWDRIRIPVYIGLGTLALFGIGYAVRAFTLPARALMLNKKRGRRRGRNR